MTRPADFFDAYCEAVASLDPATLVALYSEDARVFDAMAPAEYADRAAWATQVEDWFSGLTESRAEVEDVAAIETDELALLTGHVIYTGTLEDGEEVGVECRMTVALEKTEGDEWLVIHEHTSVPVDMDDDDDDWDDDEDDESDSDEDDDEDPDVEDDEDDED